MFAINKRIDGGSIMDLQYMRNKKKANYIILFFSIVIGSSFISIVKMTTLKIVLVCVVCYVVASFLKKRKEGKLDKSNHFIIECIIIISLTLNQLLGNLANIYKFNEFNIIEVSIVLFCVIAEGVLFFKE